MALLPLSLVSAYKKVVIWDAARKFFIKQRYLILEKCLSETALSTSGKYLAVHEGSYAVYQITV